MNDDEKTPDSNEESETRRERRIRDFARRIFRDDSEPNDDSARSSNREIIGSILETGDKAKTEIVRMIGREVRSYLEALDLHNDLHHLLTNYSLEVNASFSLKPLAEALGDEMDEESKETSDKANDD